VPRTREIERVLHLLQFGLPAYEFRKPTLHRRLEPRPKGSQSNDLENIDLSGDTFDAGRTEILENEVPIAQFSDLLGRRYRSGRRQRLHTRCQAG
jgi:hypothetical protein